MSQKWTNKVQFPRDTFILRCIDEAFAPSKASGNPMITLSFEVASPEDYDIAGTSYTVAGTKVTNYYPTIVFADSEGNRDPEKTANAQARVTALYELFGLSSDNINFENPVLGFKNKLVHALLYSEVSEQHKSPTKEQLAKGLRQGDIILNPVTKKPLVQYWPKIDEIFGLANLDPSKPY